MIKFLNSWLTEEITIEKIGNYLLEIKIIPPDGSCLYNSVAHQLYHFPVTPANLHYHSRLLRALSVNYIAQNIHNAVLRENVLFSCREMFGFAGDENTLIATYLTNLRHNPEFWGGAESLFALTNIYQVRIHVYDHTGAITTFSPENPLVERDINIIYRNWNHYDSVISVRVAQESASPNEHSIDSNPTELSQPNGEIEYSHNSSNSGLNTFLEKRTINVATWNISGGSRRSKRDEIDSILLEQGVISNSNFPKFTNLKSKFHKVHKFQIQISQNSPNFIFKILKVY